MAALRREGEDDMTTIPVLPDAAYREVFAASPHPYLLLGPAPGYTIVGANARYLQATGTEAQAIVGRDLFDVFPDNPDDPAASAVSDLRTSLERVVREARADVMGEQKYDIPRPDAAGFAVRYWSPVNTPIYGSDDKLLVILHHVEDITDLVVARERASPGQGEKLGHCALRMQAEVLRRAREVKQANLSLKTAMKVLQLREAELQHLNDRLQSRGRAKTEFFANVSHEFRTQISLMLGPLEQLLQRPEQDCAGPAGRAALEIAHRNALRLLKLVNTLLDFARVEGGRADPKRQMVELAAFTAEIASGFACLCEQAGLELLVDCRPLARSVEVDLDMWEKVVLNLLSNAYKFTFSGRIEVSVQARGEWAELRVRDTGIGIAAPELGHVFERFHRIAGARGRGGEGSGIGLALARDIVLLHGGSIEVDSVEGAGACFTVSVPMASVPASVAPPRATADTSPATAMRALVIDEARHWTARTAASDPAANEEVRGTVVLADDNADMRAYIARLLGESGYRVLVVTDGRAALAACAAEAVDLLLCDVMMPGADGLSVLRQLRAGAKATGLPVILLSARADGPTRIAGLAAGADDYLSKPFHARELIARVEGAIRLARLRRQSEGQMRKLAADYEDLYQNAPCGYHTLDADGNVLRMNRTELRWLGFSAEQLAGRPFSELMTEESRVRFHTDWNTLKREGAFHERQYELLRRGGGTLPVLASAIALNDSAGQLRKGRIMVLDYTERRRAEERLRQADIVFSTTNEAILITDARRRIVAVNPAFARITGYAIEEVLGKTPRLMQSGRHDRAFYADILQSLERTGQWQGEIWNRHRDGKVYPAWENISAVRDAAGQVAQYVAIFSDISQIKDADARMAYLAHHDVLTGLPNRLLFAANLGQAIELAKRQGRKMGMFLLDLDRFKLVNDTLGHAAGDALLQVVAQRLQTCTRAEDTVARLGGDEFAMIVNDMPDPDAAARLARKIIDVVSAPVLLCGREIVTSTSIGISIYPADAADAADLAQAADAAMYLAKGQGRNTFAFYTAAITAEASRHLAMETAMRRALLHGEFEMHYQPQVALGSGRIVGVEALLRWHDPQRGLVLPDEFIHIAEETDLIVAIGHWVLDAVLTQGARWSAQSLMPLRIAINLSGRQLLHSDMADVIEAALLCHEPLAGGVSLQLEITENILFSIERCTDAFRRLKDSGMSIAIDDFGTGYSSLSRLKGLAVDTIKIDKAFIRDIPAALDNSAITTAVIAMAHSMGLKVVAEGVETAGQINYLRQQGCDIVQGFAISHAVDASTMTGLLKADAAWSVASGQC
jgi:diguanylate cyclase (GGDEF)-like protein/PAS domain S-box-containing protein